MPNAAKVSKPVIRRANLRDAADLAPRLRQEDLQEIHHGTGEEPTYALTAALRVSNVAYAVEWKGQVIALFGVAGDSPGHPWMLASPELEQVSKSLLRITKPYVAGWLSIHRELEGYVWAENKVHIKWLRWLGFELDNAVPYGINHQPFQRFHMTNKTNGVTHV